MKSIQNASDDKSLLTPFTLKYLVNPLIVLLPKSVHPQWLSFISSFILYTAAFFSVSTELLGSVNSVFIAIMLLAYLVVNLGVGIQAQRTNLTNSLTKFTAHYFNAFNHGLFLFIVINLLGVTSIWWIIAVVLSSYLVHVIAFYEQFKTGSIAAEKIGPIEGLYIGIILILLSYVPGFYKMQLAADITAAQGVSLLFVVCCLFLFLRSIKRITHITYGIWLFVVSILIISAFSALMFSIVQSIVVVALYGIWYIGKLLMARLVDGVERSTGLFTPLVMILGYFMHDLYPTNTFIIVTVYMSINILLLIYRSVKSLVAKEHTQE